MKIPCMNKMKILIVFRAQLSFGDSLTCKIHKIENETAKSSYRYIQRSGERMSNDENCLNITHSRLNNVF